MPPRAEVRTARATAYLTSEHASGIVAGVAFSSFEIQIGVAVGPAAEEIRAAATGQPVDACIAVEHVIAIAAQQRIAASAAAQIAGHPVVGDAVVACIAIHTDAVHKGSRVLLLDDLLATGGTAAAAAALLKKVGADILELIFLIELGALKGREKLQGFPVRSLIVY